MIDDAMAFMVATVGITTGATIGGFGVGLLLGLGVFVGFWVVAGFGSMLGATIPLAHFSTPGPPGPIDKKAPRKAGCR
jgi:hypothetical protein